MSNDSVTIELIPVDMQGKRMVRPVVTIIKGDRVVMQGSKIMEEQEALDWLEEQERNWLNPQDNTND